MKNYSKSVTCIIILDKILFKKEFFGKNWDKIRIVIGFKTFHFLCMIIVVDKLHEYSLSIKIVWLEYRLSIKRV